VRTQLEAPPPAYTPLDALELQIRHVGADLMQALKGLPIPDQVPLLDQHLVQDIRWNIAEALRLNIAYRGRLCSRLRPSDLTGSISPLPAPGPSPQSLHDPPPHVAPESTGEQSTP